MRVALACVAALIAAGTAFAQINPGVPDLTTYAHVTDIPGPCPVPAGDTLLGTAGVGSACVKRVDEARPTAVQRANTTLNADCTWSITFTRAFNSSTPTVHAEAQVATGATQPITCQPTSRSTTTQSGKCFPAQTTSLAAVMVATVSVAVGSQVVNPTATTCPAGTPIMVVAADTTQ